MANSIKAQTKVIQVAVIFLTLGFKHIQKKKHKNAVKSIWLNVFSTSLQLFERTIAPRFSLSAALTCSVTVNESFPFS